MCILLALVLMSSSAVSYTYAEYARSTNAASDGRSTTWGVNLTVTGGAFATKYVSSTTYSGIDVSVKSSTTGNILAPGTTGTFTGIRATGTPEVGVNITITPNLQLSNWTDSNGNYYCPLKIKINGTTYSGTSYSSSAAFETAVENAIKAANGYYAPGTNLANVGAKLNGDYTWTWDFGLNSDGTANATTNAKDTALAGKANVALSVSCSIVQAD